MPTSTTYGVNAQVLEPRILLTHTADMRANYYGPRALAGLQALGTIITHDGATPMTAGQIISAAVGCRLIVSDRNTPGYAEVFAATPDVVAFLRCAVDIRTIDVAAASQAGVLVTQASPGFVASVAEMAFGQMIDVARGITGHVIAYRAGGQPLARKGVQLSGATIGLLGYGAIGRQIAKIAHAFGMKVLVNDPYVTSFEDYVVTASFEEVLRRSDFVLPLAVATLETENMIDAAALTQMKPSAFLINVSRGNLIDEAALTRALDQRLIAGAAMDVGRAADQMPSLALAQRPDVIATPHTAGLTPEAIEHQAMETVAQAAEILAGRIPTGAVNADHARRLTTLVRRNAQSDTVANA
jgi:D-3-phosphoglycerate dehydrogenase / 2-oxoglutarate reductase